MCIYIARSLAHRAAPARSALCLCPALGGAHPSLSDTPATPGLALWFRGEQPVSKGWVVYLRGPVLSCCRTPVYSTAHAPLPVRHVYCHCTKRDLYTHTPPCKMCQIYMHTPSLPVTYVVRIQHDSYRAKCLYIQRKHMTHRSLPWVHPHRTLQPLPVRYTHHAYDVTHREEGRA